MVTTTQPVANAPVQANRRGLARTIRMSVAISTLAALAGVSGCTGITFGAEPGVTTSPNPSATAEAFNPAVKCVTHRAGKTVVDIACAAKAFPSELPAPVRRAARAVGVISTSSPGSKESSYVTATKIGPNVVTSVAHGLEGFRSCGGKNTYFAANSIQGHGFSVDISGFSTAWKPGVLDAPRNGSDTSDAYVTGSQAAMQEFASLPDVPVKPNAKLPPGSISFLLSRQPTTGSDFPHDPSMGFPDLQGLDIIKAVSLGPDHNNPANTVFATVGTYSDGQLPFPIPGASGASAVSPQGFIENLDDLGPATPDGNAAPWSEGSVKKFFPDTEVTEGGREVFGVYGFIGVPVPPDASQLYISCKAA